MVEHSTRKHTRLSPSGAHRWLSCTASALLEAEFPDTQSEYAAEGTLAHEACEVKLRAYAEPTPKRTLTSRLNKLKKKDGWIAEMDTGSDAYLDYIKSKALSMPHAPYIAIEKSLDLDRWVPGGKGIADCILIQGTTLYVIDYKFGKGVPVSAEANPQLSLYALGAYEAYSLLYRIEEVRLVIIQPRLSDEASEWACYIDDLLEWGETVREKATEALSGDGKFTPSTEACRFCKARKVCRARADYNVRIAFEQKDDAPVTDAAPATLTPDEIGKYLTWGSDVAKWLEDLKEYALSQALLGKPVTGWKAVEGRGSRSWTDQEAAFDILVGAQFPASILYETVPLSLAKVEKVVGKKSFDELVGDYVIKNPGKPTLVPESDKREAINNVTKATDVFKED